MQARRHRASTVSRLEGTDDLAGPYRLSCLDGRTHRFVGRAKPARMLDADHAAPGERPGEHHGAGSRGPYRIVGLAGEVDAPVPGQPG